MEVGELTKRRQLWVDRLRDGSFEQGRGGLEVHDKRDPDESGFCCLGVGTKLVADARPWSFALIAKTRTSRTRIQTTLTARWIRSTQPQV